MRKSIVLFCSFFFLMNAFAQQENKLVVGIVIDQMRPDYIYKYWNKYGEGGFKKLVNEGYFFKNTHYNYIPTFTGPGHASIYTGTVPANHGIIANDWLDKETLEKVYCVKDKNVNPVGSTSEKAKMSPKNLMASTITDELKFSTNLNGKVIALSLKDRGAVLPAGHTPDGCYWMDEGDFVTSSFYKKELPTWVNNFNKGKSVDVYLAREWNTLLPIESYTESWPDYTPYEEAPKGMKAAVFPYDLKAISKIEGRDLIKATPFGNSVLTNFAIEAIAAEKLGKDSILDFLSISYSSTDYVGHQFGPNSIELEDTYLRLDKDLARLIEYLNLNIGQDKYVLFLTSDHGAIDNPNYLKDNGMSAGYFDAKGLEDSLNTFFNKRMRDSIAVKIINENIYVKTFKLDSLRQNRRLSPQKVKANILRIAKEFEGVRDVYAYEELRLYPPGSMEHTIKNGMIENLSGDYFILLKPGYINHEIQGTTHGSAYAYDTHVPLIWYGNVKKGSSVEKVYTIDIAPTLSMMLNIPIPNSCTGEPLEELFK